MVSRHTLRYAELALWVATTTAATIAVCAVPSYLFGSGAASLKFALFVVGTLLFGVGSFAIQPEPLAPNREKRVNVDDAEPYRFEDRIQELPPLRGRRLPPSDRVSRNTKLFLTAVALLAVSAGMEFLIGV